MIRMADVSFMTVVKSILRGANENYPFDSRCPRCRGNLNANCIAKNGEALKPVHPMITLCSLCGEILTTAITAGEGRFDSLSDNQRLSLPGDMPQQLLDDKARIRKPTT